MQVSALQVYTLEGLCPQLNNTSWGLTPDVKYTGRIRALDKGCLATIYGTVSGADRTPKINDEGVAIKQVSGGLYGLAPFTDNPVLLTRPERVSTPSPRYFAFDKPSFTREDAYVTIRGAGFRLTKRKPSVDFLNAIQTLWPGSVIDSVSVDDELTALWTPIPQRMFAVRVPSLGGTERRIVGELQTIYRATNDVANVDAIAQWYIGFIGMTSWDFSYSVIGSLASSVVESTVGQTSVDKEEHGVVVSIKAGEEAKVGEAIGSLVTGVQEQEEKAAASKRKLTLVLAVALLLPLVLLVLLTFRKRS